MSFLNNIAFSDPAGAPQDGALVAAMDTALTAWSAYVANVGNLIVLLTTAPFTGPIIADGGPDSVSFTFTPSGLVAQLSSFFALTTGAHIGPADIDVTFNSTLLAGLATEKSFNLVTVFEHEVMHGLGMAGFQQIYRPGDPQTPFDLLTQITPVGGDVFTGASAERVYGGPVPLTTGQPGSDYYHLGTTGTAADPAILFNDLMAPNTQPSGAPISPLDVAILADLGIPLTTAGLVLENPYPTLTASTGSANGAATTDPVVSGTTQPGETVTISAAGNVLGTVQAKQDGTWSFRASGLADGPVQLVASVPSSTGAAQFGTYLLLNAGGAVQTVYQQVLGRSASASEVAAQRQGLVTGTPFATFRASVAGSAEAKGAILAAYLSVLGRPEDYTGGMAWQASLASGASLGDIRTGLANSAEAAARISGYYAAVLGRSAAPGEIAGWQTVLANGVSLSLLTPMFSASAEAGAAINASYLAALGRAALPGDITGWRTNFANGSTLATLRQALGASSEASAAINSVFQAVLNRPAQFSDTLSWQRNLETGSSLTVLRGALANSVEAGTDIFNTYLAFLGRPAQAADTAGWQANLAGGGSMAALRIAVITSAEAISDISHAYSNALGHAASPVQVAAGQSELLSGYTVNQLVFQFAALASHAADPLSAGLGTVAITPQSVAGSGSTPSFVYGLPDSAAVISPTALGVQAGIQGTVLGEFISISGFNPATGTILLPTSLAGSFASVLLSGAASGGTLVSFTGSNDHFTIAGVAPTQLTGANFVFA